MRRIIEILVFLFSTGCTVVNATNITPPNGEVILQYSNSLEEKGKINEAILVLTEGLASLQQWNPTKENHAITQVYYAEIPLYLKLGELYVQNRNDDEALHVLEQGITRNSGSGELLEFYLKLLKKNKRGQQAKDFLKRQCSLYFISNGACKSAL